MVLFFIKVVFKFFFVRKRVNGRDKRIIIGNYPETDIEEARAKVDEVLTEATTPNFMYEGRLAGNLYGFVGGGGSIGYCWKNYTYIKNGEQSSHHNAKGGLNGFFGMEYKFQIPLTLQFDFRPGYRCIFNGDFAEHIFDWGLNFGLRYTF